MLSAHSSHTLLGQPGQDDDQSTLANAYFYASGQHTQDQYAQTTVTTQRSVEGDEYGHSTPLNSASLAHVDQEWSSDANSTPFEGDLLLIDSTPPPEYEEFDLIFNSRRTVVENQSNNGSSPLYDALSYSVPPEHGVPRLIDIDVEPQCYHKFQIANSKRSRREERCQKCRDVCQRLYEALRAIATFAFLGIAATIIIRGKDRLGNIPTCMIKNFATRDYQIQNLKHFDFSDTPMQNSGLPGTFSGKMQILSGPPDQSVDLNVTIKSIASDLRGERASSEWRPLSLKNCAEVLLYFRPGLELSTFRVTSNKLRLVLASDLIVTESTKISLKSGVLTSKNFDSSRETYIDVDSSTVRGTFSLYDVLSIKTQSSSVFVDINPKPVSETRPRPAMLEIESNSGSVHIKYPESQIDIPKRDYQSTITSRSGSINGKILLGTETTIETRSSSLDCQLLPYGMDEELSYLTTRTESGTSAIKLLEPYSPKENSLTRMVSSHSSKSGTLQLKYPREWEGSIFGETMSGSIDLKGHDIEVIDEGDGNGKYIRAKKGHGESKLKFDTLSGSVDATIG